MTYKRKFKKFLKVVSTGNFSYLWAPKRIQFIPTLKCNLNCKMCHQKDIKHAGEREMSLAEINNKLRELKNMGIHQIAFVGGEVFVNKRRGFEILDLAEQHKFLFSVATNGFRLEDEDIEKLAKYRGLVEVDISVDGPQEVHDKIRGVPDAYMWAEHAIIKCKELDIPVATVTVIQKDNIKWLPWLARKLAINGVVQATFVYEYSVSEKEIEDTKKIIHSLTGKSSTIFASHSVGKNTFKYSLKDLVDKFSQMEFFANYHGMKLNLQARDLDVLKSVKNKSITKDFDCSCESISELNQVDWTGAFDFCPFIRIDGASKEEVLEVQKKIKTLPICDRCCGLTIGELKK